MKDEKDLKPVSLRVKDAAEALLAVIFEQVGITNSRGTHYTVAIVYDAYQFSYQ